MYVTCDICRVWCSVSQLLGLGELRRRESGREGLREKETEMDSERHYSELRIVYFGSVLPPASTLRLLGVAIASHLM